MPFTPFHFGPGLFIKSLAPASFSWTAFVAVNILIDCETLYYLLQHQSPVHRTLHTFVGAMLAGAATAAGMLGVIAFARWAMDDGVTSLLSSRPWLAAEISTAGVAVGALIGGLSHPLLDGLMHRDIRPLLPWSTLNPLLGVIGVDLLHLGASLAGLLGIVILWLRRSGPKPLSN
jgi:hypothetical protein